MTSTITGNTPSLTNNALNNNSATKDTATVKEVSTNTSTESVSKTPLKVSDLVDFSARAVKIQSISKDFFSGGGLQIADIPKYVQRLQSDGFLTEEQAKKLGVEKAPSGDVSDANEAKKQVINFLDDFKKTVAETEGSDSLIALLNKAEASVKSLGEMNSPMTKANFKMVDIELKRYLESDDAKQWTEQDLKSLSQVSKLLSVVNDLNYGTESSVATNRYAQISKY